MGHRANFIIKTVDKVELYYSHWGANVIEQDLFWGPQEALAYIRTQRKMEEWLDEVWCEGGATLDVPNKCLTFFGGEDIRYDPFRRDHLLRLFKASWAPWRVDWAHRGIFDLAKACGVDESLVHSNGTNLSNLKKLNRPKLSSKKCRRCDSLLQVGSQRFTIIGKISDFLTMGPKCLSYLVKQKSQLQLDEYPPRSGVRVMEAERRLQFWELDAHPLLEEWIRAAWPGWLVERRENNAIPQVTSFMACVGQTPPTLSDSIATFRKQFLRGVKSRAIDLDYCKNIHREEAEIELNTLATEDVRPSSEGLGREAHFDAVIRKLGL